MMVLVLVRGVLVVDKGIFIATVKDDNIGDNNKNKKLTLAQRLRRWSGITFLGGDYEFYKRETKRLMNEAADFIESIGNKNEKI